MDSRYLVAPALLAGFLAAWLSGRLLLLHGAAPSSRPGDLTIETQGPEQLRMLRPPPYEIEVSVYHTGAHEGPIVIEELRLIDPRPGGQVVARSTPGTRLDPVGRTFAEYRRVRARLARMVGERGADVSLPETREEADAREALDILDARLRRGRLLASILFDPLRFADELRPGERISARLEVTYRIIRGHADRAAERRTQGATYEVWVDPFAVP